MPRISSQTAGESRERSTSGAGSVFPPTPGTAVGNPQSSPDLQDRVQSSASATAKLSVRSPTQTLAPVESYSQSPMAQTLPEKSQSHLAAAAETSQEIAQTHGLAAANSKTAPDAPTAHTSSTPASPAPAARC